MTTAESPRRPGGRSTRVRKAVLDATRSVINDQGMAGVSVPDIAARAGVHETSIYRRWGTRENLVISALLDEAEECLPIPDTGSLHDDLLAYATALVTYLSSPAGNALDRALASGDDGPTATQMRNQYWRNRYARAGQIFARAIERGELSPTIDTRLALEMLGGPIHFKVVMTREPLTVDFTRRLVARLTVSLTSSEASLQD